MSDIRIENACEANTEALGRAISERLFPGAFIALYGDLGAGKTTLTRAVASGLGMHDIASPTFTVVREHEGQIPLFHFDAYRLSDADELYAIGFSDYIERNGIIIMEWCENVEAALPDERLDIHMFGSGDEPRLIVLSPKGALYERITEGLIC